MMADKMMADERRRGFASKGRRGPDLRDFRWLAASLAALMLVGALAEPAAADPCGMVPPIYTGPGQPIERIGTQKTYVFYRDGVESIAIRPGFRGKVDQFGMLIPFPAVPELRKLPDNIFPHVKAAIDPPEVVMYIRRHYRRRRYAPMAKASAKRLSGAGGLLYDQVKVLKQEAVGMYEVAVLGAGSSRALKRWMDNHGYKFPKGMDAACDDYVKLGWCFVAVKTRVGQKKGVNPRPGMKRVNSRLPKGATFNGSVQAMGFRFRTKHLVVPMRLSAFNAGRLRNIVYILADGPRKIRQIPIKYVMRQVPGKVLYRNLTGPLPLRVIGGTIKQLRSYQRASLKRRRDPRPFTKHAAQLFAGDLLAVKKRRLSHPFEEKKKVLLEIGERLQLRGAAIDALNRQVLEKSGRKAIKSALRNIKQMTLTVVDGDFRRDVLSKQNLTFAHHRMPRGRNNKKAYDARREGPGSKWNRGGIIYRGSLDARPTRPAQQTRAAGSVAVDSRGWIGGGSLLGFGLLGLLGLLGRSRRRRALAKSRSGIVTLLVVGLATAGIAEASAATVPELIKRLGSKKRSEQRAVVRQLVQRGKSALRPLLNEAFDGNEPVRQGWALVAIGEIGDRSADGELKKIHDNPNRSMLIRTWAAAVRIKLAKGSKELLALARLASRFPATRRPLGKRLSKAFSGLRGVKAAEQMILATTRLRQLRAALAPAIMALGAKPLVKLLVSSKNQRVRRNAAAYLASIARNDYRGVARSVVGAYRFRPRAQRVSWHGGPLFLPGIAWKKKEARALVGNLVRWHLWAERKGDSPVQRQIHNNLRSLGLARAAGYSSPGWRQAPTRKWLQIWGRVIGRDKLRSLLLQQGWGAYRKYKDTLDGLQ